MSDNVFNKIFWWKITFSSVLLPISKNVLYFFGVQLSPINQICKSEFSDRKTQQGYSQNHSVVWTRKTRGNFFHCYFSLTRITNVSCSRSLQGQYILDSPFYTFITVILTFTYFFFETFRRRTRPAFKNKNCKQFPGYIH